MTDNQQAAREWLDIESAPRDGTWVLLSGGVIGYGWERGSSNPRAVVGQWAGEAAGGWQFAWYDGGYYGEYESPTHWMPLPETTEAK